MVWGKTIMSTVLHFFWKPQWPLSRSEPAMCRVRRSRTLPSVLNAMVWQFQEGMLTRLIDDRCISETLPVTSGVMQGCMFKPMLFNVAFWTVLSEIDSNYDETNIKIRFRTDGRLFNLHRLQAKPRNMPWCSIHELIFHCLQQLWPHNRYSVNRGHTPTYTTETVCGTNNHCWSDI